MFMLGSSIRVVAGAMSCSDRVTATPSIYRGPPLPPSQAILISKQFSNCTLFSMYYSDPCFGLPSLIPASVAFVCAGSAGESSENA